MDDFLVAQKDHFSAYCAEKLTSERASKLVETNFMLIEWFTEKQEYLDFQRDSIGENEPLWTSDMKALDMKPWQFIAVVP